VENPGEKRIRPMKENNLRIAFCIKFFFYLLKVIISSVEEQYFEERNFLSREKKPNRRTKPIQIFCSYVYNSQYFKCNLLILFPLHIQIPSQIKRSIFIFLDFLKKIEFLASKKPIQQNYNAFLKFFFSQYNLSYPPL